MTRSGDGMPAFQPSFMSGKGKSFFLHDLLRRVIFEERDWVSHDRKAVRRSLIWRSIAASAIGLVTVGLLAAFGFSYWQNATLVQTAAIEADNYARAADAEINRDLIDDADLRPVLPFLEDLRTMPAGYGDSEKASWWEGFGLGQRRRLAAAAEESYSDALERMLRPRLVLAIEQEMPDILRKGETTEIYRALKVYMLLGGQGEHSDDEAIKAWFSERWRAEFPNLSGLDIREQLDRHLDAMLTLDNSRDLLVDIDEATVVAARQAIVQLPLVDQAYALIMDRADTSNASDWSLLSETGPSAPLVFVTKNGDPLDTLTVPKVFTYEGFWGYFYPQLEVVGDRLRDDQWVLGEAGDATEFDAQLQRLDRALLERYRLDFKAAWDGALGQIALASMSADKPRYEALRAMASPTASPLLLLARSVDRETYLSREFEGLDGLEPRKHHGRRGHR